MHVGFGFSSVNFSCVGDSVQYHTWYESRLCRRNQLFLFSWMLFPVWSRHTFSVVIRYLPSGRRHGGYTGWRGSENTLSGLVGEIIFPLWLWIWLDLGYGLSCHRVLTQVCKFLFRLNWCKIFTKVVYNMRVFAHESSAIWQSPLLFYYFRCVAQPATRDNHVFQLRRGPRVVRSVRVLYDVTSVSQVQTTLAQPMLCEIDYAKYLRGETRSFCIIWSNVSAITFKQSNTFLCANELVHMSCRIAMRWSRVIKSSS